MNKILKLLLLIPLYFLLTFVEDTSLNAQVFPMFNGKIYACDGKFTDSGSESGSYKANENIVTTICSDNPSKANIKLNFYTSDIKSGDELCIYDGFDLTAPLITCTSDHNNFPFVVEASKTNSSGCLTLQFKSNNFLQGLGWKATIECIPQCQKVLADINVSSTVGILNNGFLDICPGDAVDLTANLNFPENDLNYHQEETGCSYNWIINNKIKLKGKSISLPKLSSGGYSVHLVVKDTFGCINNNTALQKVRVAPAPDFYINSYDSVLCLNNTLKLSASLTDDKSYDVSTKAGKGYFPAYDFLADTFALPDGTGKVYTSTIYVDRFDPVEYVDEIEDVQSICINMEHSFIKDLEISISCPSGKKITLQNQQPSPGSVFLGIPFEGDEVLPEPVPGIGWDYCWSMQSNLGDWNDFILKNSVTTLPANIYNPYQTFSDLIGCPINGPWTIEIVDLWQKDNGYVYSWGLNFNPVLYPPLDSFTNQLVSGQWLNNPGLSLNNNQDIWTMLKNAGRVENIWEVKDQAGCRFTASVPVTFLPAQHPECLSCTDLFKPLKDSVVCAGQVINLVANENKSLTKSVDFTLYTSNDFVGSTVADLKIPVISIQPSIISAPITDISSVCISLETEDLTTLGFTLLSPEGKSIELIKTGEIIGTQLTKTCFQPLSSANISGGIAPYSSNFKAKDPWTNFLNAKSAGEWKLQITKPINQSIKLDSLNIKFNILQSINLSWKSNNTIVFPTCPSIKLPIAEKSYFELTAKDLYGCTQIDTSIVDILVAYPAPVVTYLILGSGMIQFSWLPLAGAGSYEISVNGMPWEPTNGALFHLISELKPGELVSVKVRVSQKGVDCINEIGTASAVYTECNLNAVATATSTSCAGKSDGSIKVNVITGKPPYLYSFNGGSFNANSIYNNLKEGLYTIIVSDIKFCKDTLSVLVSPPAPIVANFSLDSVSCYGLFDGKAIANTTGGFAPFTYKWSTTPGQGPNSISNLGAGNYKVTITDNKSCSTVESFTIEQPEEILAILNPTDVLCNGMSSGVIKSIVAGGTGPYSFKWNTLATTPDIQNLAPGIYDVTIEDSKNCQIYKSAEVKEPSPITIIPTFESPSCFGINDGSCTVKVSGGTSPYKYLWNDKNKSTGMVAQNLAPGTYKVVVTDKNGCTAVQTFVLQDPPMLNVTVKTTDEHCPETNDGLAIVSITSGNGPFNYTWSKAGSPNANIASGLSPGTYTVTISNDNGCSLEELFVINPAEPIVADVTTEPVACPNSNNGHATVNVSGGYPPFFYFWNDPSKQNSSTALNLNVGSYNVTVTDSRNCQAVLPAEITSINPVSVISSTITNTSCNNTSDGQLDIQLGGGIPPYNITWSGGLPINQTNVTSLPKGLYDLTVTDAAGCFIAQTFEITSPEPVKSDFISKSVTCYNLSDGSLIVNPSGGTAPYSYNWSNGPISSDNLDIAGGTYDVTITDNNGCTAVASSVVNAPSVQLDFDVVQSFKACNGEDKNEAKISITSSTSSAYNYSWSNGAGNLDNIKALKPGTYDVTVSDSYGCNVVKSVTVDDWDPITLTYNTTPSTCDISNDAVLTIVGINGGAGNGTLNQYTININGKSGGLITTQLASGQSNNIVIIDNQGCKSNQVIDIPVTESLSYEIVNANPTCYKGSNGEINVQNIAGGTAPYEVVWVNGIKSPVNTNLEEGKYDFTIVDAKGCKISGQSTLDDPEQIDITNFKVVNNLCEYDQKGEIDLQPAVGKAPYTINWSNGAFGNSIKSLASADYSVTVTDANNCTVSSKITISSKNKIIADALAVAPRCPGDQDGSIEMDVRVASQPVSFSLNNGSWQPDNLFQGLAPGNYQCSVKDKEGCINQWTVTVENSALLNVNNLSNISLESGESTTLTADITSSAPVTIEWKSQEANIFSCNNCTETIISPTITGTCWLIAVSETGCSIKIPFTVRIIKSNEIFVPTAFSPNQDGVNDRLSIFGKPGNIIKSFKVFDQWGEMVYSQSNPELNNDSQGWDGRFNNQTMNTGVFVWMAEVLHKDGTTETLSGESTLLR